jgi:hypothetical protein
MSQGLLTIAVLTALALFVWFMIDYGTPQNAMTALVGTLCFLGFITFALSVSVLSSKRRLRAFDTVVYSLLITLYIVLSAIMVYKIQTATTIAQMRVPMLMVFGVVGVITANLLYGVRA